MMSRVKAVKKSRKLYICMALNVIEGIMSGSNFTILYFLLNAILQNDLTREKLMKYASILGIIFVLCIYGIPSLIDSIKDIASNADSYM